jgi:hypothetical protein
MGHFLNSYVKNDRRAVGFLIFSGLHPKKTLTIDQ